MSVVLEEAKRDLQDLVRDIRVAARKLGEAQDCAEAAKKAWTDANKALEEARQTLGHCEYALHEKVYEGVPESIRRHY